MHVFRQEKKRFYGFLKELMGSYELIAPVECDVVRFLQVKDPKDIFLERNAFFPIKEHFFKKHEVLFHFDGNSMRVPLLESPPRAFFGLRRCDLNAIRHQDMVYLEDAKDPYYTAARKNTVLIGLHCKEPMTYCFCGSLDLVDYFDLNYHDRSDHYLVEVGSTKGEALVSKHKAFFSSTQETITPEQKVIKDADRLKIKDIKQLYEHPDWKKGVDLCLSCTACTALCPSCYCFSLHDEPSMADLKKGVRRREWSSCQLQEFSRVAGNSVFRKERDQRFKHRIYHQLQYFKERYGTNLCVGCGRCIEGCPTRIDFVGIINGMRHG
ncbi:MAG: 4Fe-4S dicluster domain-containing protein [Nanoarchaeota archaeon]